MQFIEGTCPPPNLINLLPSSIPNQKAYEFKQTQQANAATSEVKHLETAASRLVLLSPLSLLLAPFESKLNGISLFAYLSLNLTTTNKQTEVV